MTFIVPFSYGVAHKVPQPAFPPLDRVTLTTRRKKYLLPIRHCYQTIKSTLRTRLNHMPNTKHQIKTCLPQTMQKPISHNPIMQHAEICSKKPPQINPKAHEESEKLFSNSFFCNFSIYFEHVWRPYVSTPGGVHKKKQSFKLYVSF